MYVSPTPSSPVPLPKKFAVGIKRALELVITFAVCFAAAPLLFAQEVEFNRTWNLTDQRRAGDGVAYLSSWGRVIVGNFYTGKDIGVLTLPARWGPPPLRVTMEPLPAGMTFIPNDCPRDGERERESGVVETITLTCDEVGRHWGVLVGTLTEVTGVDRSKVFARLNYNAGGGDSGTRVLSGLFMVRDPPEVGWEQPDMTFIAGVTDSQPLNSLPTTSGYPFPLGNNPGTRRSGISYTLSGLPSGLLVEVDPDSANRPVRVHGTTISTGNHAVTFEVEDLYGRSASLTFTVTVNSDLGFRSEDLPAVEKFSDFPYGAARDQFYLWAMPRAHGGEGAISYTLHGDGGGIGGLPAGLSFTAFGNPTLSGTPQAQRTKDYDPDHSDHVVTRLTYTATDHTGTVVSLTFPFETTVMSWRNEPPAAEVTFLRGRAVTRVFPFPRDFGLPVGEKQAFVNVNFDVLPEGMNFRIDNKDDPSFSRGVLTGTPTSLTPTDSTYTAVTLGDSLSRIYRFRVIGPDFGDDRRPADLVFALNRAVSLTLPEATGGTTATRYALSGALPRGLSFDKTTRVLSGVPSRRNINGVRLIYAAGDAAGAWDRQPLTATVVPAARYLRDTIELSFTRDTAVNATLPAAGGGATVADYAFAYGGRSLGDLGLSMNESTRVLSGASPSVHADAATITVTAIDTHGFTDELTVHVRVVPVPRFTSGTAVPGQGFTKDRPIAALTFPASATNTGASPLTHTLAPMPPDGLGFDGVANPPTLSGTPVTVLAETEYTYAVTDANGVRAALFFPITVNPPPLLPQPVDLRFTAAHDNAFTLPEADGGTAPHSYTLTPNAVLNAAGLSFASATRVVGGTPSASAPAATVTYGVTDAAMAGAGLTFNISVVEAVSFGAAAVAEQSYTKGTEIPVLVLPSADGGLGTLFYGISDFDGLTGLEVTQILNTRTLGGTPASVGAHDVVWSASDANGATANLTFILRVFAEPAFDAGRRQSDHVFTMGAAAALVLPEVSGGAPGIGYALSGELPEGLSFAGATRTISGTPDTPDAIGAELTYTATDANGTSAEQRFTVTVADVPGFASQTLNLRFTHGTPVNHTLPAVSGGAAPVTYGFITGGRLLSSLGLSLDPGNRVLSGVAPIAHGDSSLIAVTATDANDLSAELSVQVRVVPAPTFASAAAVDNQTYNMGGAITTLSFPVAEAATGAAPLFYTLTPEAPGGLDFGGDADPPTLSGTPSAVPAETEYTYAVHDANGARAELLFNILINGALAFPAASDELSFTAGHGHAFTLPQAGGGTPPHSYELMPHSALAAAGLGFVPASRVLSGAPPAVAGATAFTYTVTDKVSATAGLTFSISVVESVRFGGAAVAEQSYTHGAAITALTLPNASGGVGTTHAISDYDGLQGLSVSENNGTHTLAGAPLSAAGVHELVWNARDANGARETLTFTVRVFPEPAFGADRRRADVALVAEELTTLVLPAATGGTPEIQYLLGPDAALQTLADNGLSYDAASRTLAGTPDAAAAGVPLTYTARDANGVSIRQTFRVAVVNAPAFTPDVLDLSYTTGLAVNITLPAVSGGAEPIDYSFAYHGRSLESLDLVLSESPRVLSSVAVRSQSTAATVTMTATDANNYSAELTVRVRVASAPNFDGIEVARQDFVQHRSIALTLPAASSGTAPLFYALTDGDTSDGNLPAGLLFDGRSGARLLHGASTAIGTRRDINLTYTVTDFYGVSNTLIFAVDLLGPPAFPQNTVIPDQIYAYRENVVLTLPIVGGGSQEELRYTLGRPHGGERLPKSLVFSANGGTSADPPTLRGQVTVGGNAVFTYTATDSTGISAALTFRITVPDTPHYGDVLVPTMTFTQGHTIVPFTLPSVVNAEELREDGFVAEGSHVKDGTYGSPSGMKAFGGLLFGTPGRRGTYGVELNSSYLSSSDSTRGRVYTTLVFSFVIVGRPTFGNATVADLTYTDGIRIPDLTLPAATRGAGELSYTLAPMPPAAPFEGLVFDPASRVLSGTPSGAGGELTLTATDGNGAATTLGFRINTVPALSLSQSDLSYTANFPLEALHSAAGRTLSAAAGGLPPLNYSLGQREGGGTAAIVPPGLSFDRDTRELRGTPVYPSSYTPAYAVRDQNGAEDIVSITIVINPELAFVHAGANVVPGGHYSIDLGQALNPPLTLPSFRGGTGIVTGSLAGPAVGDGLAGLRRDGNVLSGVLNDVGGRYVWKMTDTTGAFAALTFLVTSSGPVFDRIIGTRVWRQSEIIEALTLPAATPGDSSVQGATPIHYRLEGVPARLMYDGDTRVLSGAPGEAGDITMTFFATDSQSTPVVSRQVIAVEIVPDLSFHAEDFRAVHNYNPAQVIALTLPRASGEGAVAYDLLGEELVAWLTYTAESDPAGAGYAGVLSGAVESRGQSVLLSFVATDSPALAAPKTIGLTFSIISSGPVFDGTVEAREWRQLEAIEPLTFPTATAFDASKPGAARISYRLDGVPAGLSYDGATRVLSGIPSEAGGTMMVFVATDDQSPPIASRLVIAAEVVPKLTFYAHDIGAGDNYEPNMDIVLALPQAEGAGNINYVLSGLRSWLAYDGNLTAPGTITGAVPSLGQNALLIYTATDSPAAVSPQTIGLTFLITSSGPVFAGTVEDQVWRQGLEIAGLTLPMALPVDDTVEGAADIRYQLHELPAGLHYDSAARVLSGTPSEVGNTHLTYTATDNQAMPITSRRVIAVDILPAVNFDGLTVAEHTFTQGVVISSLVLPLARDGEAVAGRSGNTRLDYSLGADDFSTVDFGGLGGMNLLLPTNTRARGLIAGVPDAVGTYHLTWAARDNNGVVAALSFTIHVAEPVRFDDASVADRTYTRNTDIGTLTLPRAHGGVPINPAVSDELLYGLEGARVTGLSNLLLPRAGLPFPHITGTPTGATGNYQATLVAVGGNGSTTRLGFTITIVPEPELTVNARSFTAGFPLEELTIAVADRTPAKATGGASPLHYRLTARSGGGEFDIVPPGLSLDRISRVLSGTPGIPGSYSPVYAVTDHNGAEDSVTFAIVINDPITLRTGDIYVGQGDLYDTISGQPLAIPLTLPAYEGGGTGAVTEALFGPGPSGELAGLNFDDVNGVLSGTLDTDSGGGRYIWQVIDETGAFVALTFFVTDSNLFFLPHEILENHDYDPGEVFSLVLPRASGEEAIVYDLIGEESATWLTYDGDSENPGVLSGALERRGQSALLTYTAAPATVAPKIIRLIFRITSSGPVFVGDAEDQTWRRFEAIVPLTLPAAEPVDLSVQGATPISYRLEGAPAGLSFDENTRELSGAPSTAGITEMTYIATDSQGMPVVSKQVIVATVLPELIFHAHGIQAGRNYNPGEAIALTLPRAEGGEGAISYDLYGEESLAWLAYTAESDPAGAGYAGILSGAVESRGQSAALTFIATDTPAALESKTIRLVFRITSSGPVFVGNVEDQTWRRFEMVVPLTLPAAEPVDLSVQGATPISYRLEGAPADLSFDENTRELSGTPSTAGITEMTYIATDSQSMPVVSKQVVVATVPPELIFHAYDIQASRSYNPGEAIALTLPRAEGGEGAISYDLYGEESLAWLAYTAESDPAGAGYAGILSGAVESRGQSATLTLTATDTPAALEAKTIRLVFRITSSGPAFVGDAEDQTWRRFEAIVPLTLPAAEPGNPSAQGATPIFYRLEGAPAGLSFDENTRELSGTPSTAGITGMTYIATDSQSMPVRSQQVIVVTVLPELTFHAHNIRANQNYGLGEAIALALPRAEGGGGVISYDLRGEESLTWLVYSGGSGSPGVLSGAIESRSQRALLTYTATDAPAAAAPKTIRLIFLVGGGTGPYFDDQFDGDEISDRVYLHRRPQAYEYNEAAGYPPLSNAFPAATRDAKTAAETGALTYRLVDADGSGVRGSPGVSAPYVAPGLVFNPSTRTLDGVPEEPGRYDLTYRVNDGNGDMAELYFSAHVVSQCYFHGFVDDVVTPVGHVLISVDSNDGVAKKFINMPLSGGGVPGASYRMTDSAGRGVYGSPGAEAPYAVPGLTFSFSTSSGVMLRGTPTEAGSSNLVYTLFDPIGTPISLTFTLEVTSEPVFVELVRDIGHLAGDDALSLTLPEAYGAINPIYRLTTDPDAAQSQLPEGLSFDGVTRVLSGSPESNVPISGTGVRVRAVAGVAPRAYGSNLMYLVNADNGAVSQTFRLFTKSASENKAPLFVAAGHPDYECSPGGTDLNGCHIAISLGPETSAIRFDPSPYFIDENNGDRHRYKAVSSNPEIARVPATATAPGGLLTVSLQSAGLTADLRVTATDPHGGEATGTLRITIQRNAVRAPGSAFTGLNKALLPDIARAIAGQNINAITRRIFQVVNGKDNVFAYSLAGHTNLETVAATQARALVEGQFDLKRLLTRSGFVAPLSFGTQPPTEETAASAPVSPAPAQGVETVAFWGSGAYRDFAADSGGNPIAVDWDGALYSAHLGADFYYRPGVLAGFALSGNKSDIHFKRSTTDDRNPDTIEGAGGSYALSMMTLSPYLAWSAFDGQLHLWASAGYGKGGLEIKERGAASAASGAAMRTLAAGASGVFLRTGDDTSWRLKSEVLRTVLQIDRSSDIEPLDVHAGSLRLSVESTGTHGQPHNNRALLERILEAGIRRDFGEGNTGSAIELRAGLRRTQSDSGFFFEGNIHTLIGRDDYNEWGVQGQVLLPPIAGGIGPSLSLATGYGGNSNSLGLKQIWRHEGDVFDDAGDYALRMDARLSYGLLAPKIRSLLTPFSEISLGADARSLRLGLNWRRDDRFDLDFTAERGKESGKYPTHTILLRGKLYFNSGFHAR